MSHIRCLTNPEALYIFDSASLAGMTEITHRIDPQFASPWRKQDRWLRVPTRDFHEVCKRWLSAVEDEVVEVGQIKVEEVHVYECTGKRVPKREPRWFEMRWRRRYAIKF